MPNKAIFLDSDGVINTAIIRNGKPVAPTSLAELEIPAEVKPALEKLKAAGYLLICVTNKPDIERGLVTQAILDSMIDKLRQELPLDDMFICYSEQSDNYKPKPGMLLEAAKKYDIDLGLSYMIGDRWRDVTAGHNAPCKTIWIDRGYAEKRPYPPANFTAYSLDEATQWILDPASTALDELCINTIRTLSIDAVQKANSGHPGLPLGAAPMAYVLWTHFLRHNPSNPHWYDRDRFVLSAGHGSMLLYSLLHLTGYALPLDQIKQFRQWDSITPGHPEYKLTPGVEITTGPLGQGFANGVGMAIAEAYLGASFNRGNFNIIDHFTYGIVSDGDLMEGVASEAASLAGHLKLGKLIYLYDNNHITLSASTHLHFTEDCAKRFDAYGWHTVSIDDGNDLAALYQAIDSARQETGRPSLILIRTHIGYGSPHKHDTFEAHGSPLGVEEVKLTKQSLDWPEEPEFLIPDSVKTHMQKAMELGNNAESAWNAMFTAYAQEFPQLADQLQQIMHGELQPGWDLNIPKFAVDAKGLSTRVAAGQVMQAINPNIPGLIGGSADLNPSTMTALINYGNFQNSASSDGDVQGSLDGGWKYSGRNLFYGVREHAMGSISNGLATFKGIIPFTATFLTFSDYMRPAIRLAALMQLQVIYVFTHDSMALGEDGPTHQPIEQLASLRAIPELIVIRPADANETAIAWQVAITTRNNPVALIFSRQNLPTLDRKLYAAADNLRQGAYILLDALDANPEIILIATGSEVSLIVAAQLKLAEQKIRVRLVSMPSWELFAAQSQEYQDSVLPPKTTARLAVEAGVAQGWDRYVGVHGAMISVEKFGASAPGPIVMEKYGFTVANVCARALALLK